MVDGIVGVLGVALLVIAGVLGETLPEEDVFAEQFLPVFEMQNAAAMLSLAGETEGKESQVFTFVNEGDEHVLSLAIPHDNVISINMLLRVPADDIASSLPDAFTFKLYDPDGNQVGDAFKVNTAQPKQRPDTVPGLPLDPGTVENLTKPIYVGADTQPATSWRLDAPADPEFIGGEGQKVDRTMALSIAIDKYTQYTNGTWSLVFKLTNAGDCPTASPSGQNDRYLECMRDTGNSGQDPGNPITVRNVRYDYYVITLPEPETEETTDAI